MTYKAFTIDQIVRGFKTVQIKSGQVDFNGLCNAKCWYCPVKYEGNPAEFKTNTSIQDIETILLKIGKSKYIAPGFDFVYSCHYNEILLHPQFEELLEVFRRRGMRTMILSNGTPLTPSKLDIVLKYPDVVAGICLNVPDIDKEKWAKKAGFSETVYNTLLRNLSYINQHYPQATIQVNTTTLNITSEGIVGSQEENDRIANEFKKLFPNLGVTVLGWLSDRAGRLSEHKVMVKKTFNTGRIITGCSHSNTEGGRIYSWFHVGPKGDLFICCDDYEMKYTFGNLLTHDFDEIWESQLHAEMVLKAQSEICRNCSSAV